MMAMPLLRFKQDNGNDYPDWEKEKLCNITEYRSAKADNTNDKYIGTENILQRCAGVVLNTNNDLRRGTAFYKGDILSSNIRPYLKKSWFALWDGIASNDVLVFKVMRGLPKFVYLILSSDKFFNYSMNGAKPGNKMPRGDKDFIKNMDVFLPCPEEQQKIADFFTAIDNQIEQYQQSLDNLESQKKELLRQVFSQELRFTKDDGSDYPDWEEDKLENIVGNVSSGRTNKSNTGKVLLYGSTGIIGYCDNEDYPNCKLLIARVGANCGFVNYVDVPCGVTDNTLIINDTNKCHLKWLYYMLTVQKLNRYSKSNVKPLITGTLVKNLCLLFPCPEEQQKIADFFSDFDERIELERQRLQTMQELKKGLLQQMFC